MSVESWWLWGTSVKDEITLLEGKDQVEHAFPNHLVLCWIEVLCGYIFLLFTRRSSVHLQSCTFSHKIMCCKTVYLTCMDPIVTVSSKGHGGCGAGLPVCACLFNFCLWLSDLALEGSEEETRNNIRFSKPCHLWLGGQKLVAMWCLSIWWFWFYIQDYLIEGVYN